MSSNSIAELSLISVRPNEYPMHTREVSMAARAGGGEGGGGKKGDWGDDVGGEST